MKKLAQVSLWVITTLGGYLVAQGVLTGEELSELQNVIGMILAGGGLTGNIIIALIAAIPTSLVSKAYDKAVETYGEDKVTQVLDNFDKAVSLMDELKSLVTDLRTDILLDRQIKDELGVYEPLSDELKSQL